MRRRLVVAAHADDETIGCGGTIAKHLSVGASIFVGVLTRDMDDGAHRIRQREAAEAWRMLGVEEADWALERAHPLTVSPGSVDAVSGWLIRFRPDVVFVPHEKEQDPDHAMVSQVVRSAMLHSGCVRPILGYEVWMPISRPALFEDVTSVLAAKKGAIGRFASQTRDRDYVAGSVGLNRFRGVMSGNGDYVEVFNLVGM